MLFVLVLVAWGLALFYDVGSDEVTGTVDKIWASSFLAFPLVGTVLAWRLPANPVGWLFLIGPLVAGAGIALSEAAESRDLPGLVPIADFVFPAGIVCLFAAIILFPDGRYPNRWWALVHALAIVALIFSGGEGPAFDVNVALPVLALIFRVVTGDTTVRRQIGWPVFVVLTGLAVMATVSILAPPSVVDNVMSLLMLILTVGIPLAIGASILRYRLYDLDRIVSHTVGYALVLGLLGLVYVAVAVWLPSQLMDSEPPLFVAGATLAAAALFNPLRRRVLDWVDHRFYRSRYDAERVVDDFSSRLRDQVDPEQLTDDWLNVVTATMRPASAGVWLRDDAT
ncbi:MAG: hypothetical protein ACRDVD_05330 [Acidimicrobiia bacterium]